MSGIGRIGELWRFREVIKNFVSQDLKVKYRRSSLGFFWSLLNPLLQMTVLSVVFSLLFRIQNFPLYILSGVLPWTFFVTSIDGCAMSLVSSEGMLRRQYFPKLVFPLSFVIQNLITFVLSLVVLTGTIGPFIGLKFTPALAILPLSFVFIVCMAVGLGALAAVVTVYFRDMQHLIAVFTQAWFYLTPIMYPLETGIPREYHFYFKLNPMYSLVQMFRRPIYDGIWPTGPELAAAGLTAGIALLVGSWLFWRHEDRLIFAL